MTLTLCKRIFRDNLSDVYEFSTTNIDGISYSRESRPRNKENEH